MDDNVVSLRNLRFSYPRRNVKVLHGLDLDIPRGKMVAIMGGSGSGKTTLLRLITGQYQPSPGSEIIVDGERVDQMRDIRQLYRVRRKLGMLFQFSGLFTDLSAGENVAYPLREHTSLSPTTIRDLVLLKLQAVGLRAAFHRHPAELSGGQQRRLALARAIALDPQLLLYDEPFTGLDPVSKSVIVTLIKELNEALGSSSIIITHDVAETFSIVDYVYLLWHGKIIADGTPEQLRQSTDPFVHQFINAKADGPLPFHMPGTPLGADLRLRQPEA